MQHFGNNRGNNFNPRYASHHGNFNRGNGASTAVNSFDDKNRDTFGEDFVMDHQIQQQARQQRYHYGEREQNYTRGKKIYKKNSTTIFFIKVAVFSAYF